MNTKSENIPEELKKLQDNRALILLVELMGFLHDVGKLDEELYQNHYKRYNEDKNKNILPPILKEVFRKNLKELLKNIISDDLAEKLENVKIEGFQRHQIGRHPEEYWPKNWMEEIINLADSKDSSEDRGRAIAKQEEFKASVFGKEEELKKGEFKEKRKKLYGNLSVILLKEILDVSSDEYSIRGIKNNANWLNFHKRLSEAIEVFEETVASTFRSSNDVTLFDHSYMTGSIAKALIGKLILNKETMDRFNQQIIRRNAEIEQHKPNLSPEEREINKKTLNEIEPLEHFSNECDLDLLMISFDGFGFISEGINLLDIRGRKIVLEEIKNSVKNLLEVNYPVGNCIYEDENNLCFLITHLSDESIEYLENEIYEIFNENTCGLLTPIIDTKQNLKYYGKSLVELKEKNEKPIKEGLVSKFDLKRIETWRGSNGKDRCVLCNKMPQWKGKESEYLCEFCYNLRRKREEGRRREEREKEEEKRRKEDSIWVDEIADENGKIALLVGMFHPIDKWLSGEFLKYQKIRIKKDLEEHPHSKKLFANIPEDEYEKIRENAVTKFINILSNVKNNEEIVNKQVKELTELDGSEKAVIGGKSKVGEFYYRLGSEISKERVLEIMETKPPSPSRLYRIWRELKEFSDEIIDEARKSIPKGKRLKFKLDGFNGNPGFYRVEIIEIGEIEVYYDGNLFYTVERIDKVNPSDKTEGVFLSSHLKLGEKIKLEENKVELFDEEKRSLGEFLMKDVSFEEYYRVREVLSSPNGFMFIIPANKSLEVANNIRNRFEERFSKVLGKISLNVGIAFSHKKNPIYVLLDCGKRFVEEFRQKDIIECKVSEKNKLEKHIELEIETSGKKFRWRINHLLGDGKQDYYYPNFISKEGLINVNDLNQNDEVRIYCNYLDYENILSSQDRFKIFLSPNKGRKHDIMGENGPRPYLLEDLEKFQKLKEIFEKVASWTPIRDIESVAISKLLEWGKTETYKKLLDSLVENKLSRFFGEEWKNYKPFLLASIIDGSFFDGIELFGSIMKIELGGDKNEK